MPAYVIIISERDKEARTMAVREIMMILAMCDENATVTMTENGITVEGNPYDMTEYEIVLK